MLEFDFDPNSPDTTNGDFYCRVCLISSNSDVTWQSHLAGAKHIRRVGKGVKGLEKRQMYKNMEKEQDEDSNFNLPEKRFDDLSNSVGDYPYTDPHKFLYGNPRDYPYRDPNIMYIDSLERMYDRDFTPGDRPSYFSDSRDPLYNADSRGSFSMHDGYLPEDIPLRPSLDLYRDSLGISAQELPHSAIPKLVFDYSKKTSVPSIEQPKTPAETSSVKASVPPLPEPPKPPFITKDSQVDSANSLHPPAFLSQSAPFKEKDTFSQTCDNSDPLQNFIKGLFNSDVPADSLTKLIDDAFSKTKDKESPQLVAPNPCIQNQRAFPDAENRQTSSSANQNIRANVHNQDPVPKVEGDISSRKQVIDNLFGQTNIDNYTASFHKSLQNAVAQQKAYSANAGEQNSDDNKNSLEMILKDILDQNASSIKMSNQNLMNVIASAKAAIEDACQKGNDFDKSKFALQSKFDEDTKNVRDFGSPDGRRDGKIDSKKDSKNFTSKKDKNDSFRRYRDRDESPRHNRDRGYSPSRNRGRNDSPRRYQDKSNSPTKNKDRGRNSSPKRYKDKDESLAAINAKKDLPKRYANADRDRIRDDSVRRRERDQLVGNEKNKDEKNDKNREKFDPVQRYRRPEDVKLGKNKKSTNLDVNLALPTKKVKKVKLDEVDPDNLCPDDVDSLLSSFLKKPTDLNEKEILVKVEKLPTKSFLRIILKKLDNLEIQDMEELNLLTQVIVKAQGAAYKKMPARVQAAMLQKMALNSNTAPPTGVLPIPVGHMLPTPQVSPSTLLARSKISDLSTSSTAIAAQTLPPVFPSSVPGASHLSYPSMGQTGHPVSKSVSSLSLTSLNSSNKQTHLSNQTNTSSPSTSGHETGQLPQVDQKKVLAAYSKLLQSYRDKAGLPPDAALPNLDSMQMSKLLSVAIAQSSVCLSTPPVPAVSNRSRPKQSNRALRTSSSSRSSSSSSSSSSSNSSSSDSSRKSPTIRQPPPAPKPKLSFSFAPKKSAELPSTSTSKEWKDFFIKR